MWGGVEGGGGGGGEGVEESKLETCNRRGQTEPQLCLGLGNRHRLKPNTHFSLSPSHLDMRSEEDTEKKVELLASVATALAR